MSSPTILICDDDDGIRRLVATVLSVDGYDITQTPDTESAMSAIAERAPDVAILDYHVPTGGGTALLAHIRASPETARTAVLFVTGDTDARAPGWAEEVGADARLPKPFDLTELRDTVRRLLPAD